LSLAHAQPCNPIKLLAEQFRDTQMKIKDGKGDRVIVQTDGDRVEITTAQRARRRAQERFRRLVPEGEAVVDTFIAEKRAEAARDDRPNLTVDPKATGA
jgi:hypothetical protein